MAVMVNVETPLLPGARVAGYVPPTAIDMKLDVFVPEDVNVQVGAGIDWLIAAGLFVLMVNVSDVAPFPTLRLLFGQEID